MVQVLCAMIQLKCTMVYHSLPWYKLFVPWYSYTVPWYTTVYRGIPWLHHGCTMVLFHKGTTVTTQLNPQYTVAPSLIYSLPALIDIIYAQLCHTLTPSELFHKFCQPRYFAPNPLKTDLNATKTILKMYSSYSHIL